MGRDMVLLERLKRSCGTIGESPHFCLLKALIFWCASAELDQDPLNRGTCHGVLSSFWTKNSLTLLTQKFSQLAASLIHLIFNDFYKINTQDC